MSFDSLFAVWAMENGIIDRVDGKAGLTADACPFCESRDFFAISVVGEVKCRGISDDGYGSVDFGVFRCKIGLVEVVSV